MKCINLAKSKTDPWGIYIILKFEQYNAKDLLKNVSSNQARVGFNIFYSWHHLWKRELMLLSYYSTFVFPTLWFIHLW